MRFVGSCGSSSASLSRTTDSGHFGRKQEAHRHAETGIRVMPTPWHRLRVSVVTNAAWGNAKDCTWIEDNSDDWREERETSRIRHHVAPRRTAFHPGAAPGGPDLHEIAGKLWPKAVHQHQRRWQHGKFLS